MLEICHKYAPDYAKIMPFMLIMPAGGGPYHTNYSTIRTVRYSQRWYGTSVVLVRPAAVQYVACSVGVVVGGWHRPAGPKGLVASGSKPGNQPSTPQDLRRFLASVKD